MSDYIYRQRMQAYYLPEIEKVRVRIREEKDWILKNQGENGAIYFSDSRDTVNPYFACFAVLGLYEGECRPQDLEAADRYLKWHCQRFLVSDGKIPDYEIQQGVEIEREPDSMDAYIALYLLALCKKQEVTGSLTEDEKRSIGVGIRKLEDMTESGLTNISEESEICYYMDNVEVLAAYRELGKLAGSRDEYAEFARQMSDKYKIGLEQLQKVFWSDKAQCYMTLKGDPKVLTQEEGFSEFYPDAIAQVYGEAFNFTPVSDKISAKLWRTFCDHYAWEEMDMGGDAFYWTELSYIAIQQGDIARAKTYLDFYTALIKESRAYPFYIGNCGWAVKAYAQLEDYYEKKINSGLFQNFFGIRKQGER